jgi:hypothetical protein
VDAGHSGSSPDGGHPVTDEPTMPMIAPDNSDIADALAHAETMEAVVLVALGMASVCWKPPPVRQKFDAERAQEIARALMIELNRRGVREA